MKKSSMNSRNLRRILSTVLSYLKLILLLFIVIEGVIYTNHFINTSNKNKSDIQEVKNMVTDLSSSISLSDKRRIKIIKGSSIIHSLNPRLSYPVSVNYAEWYVDEANKYENVDYLLLIAISAQESMFNKDIVSISGAVGLMQMLPSTAEERCQLLHIMYKDTILYDPRTNIMLGANYVNRLMTVFNNNTELAVSGYNAGIGGAINYRNYKNGLVDSNFVATENLKYIPRVLKYYEKFKTMK